MMELMGDVSRAGFTRVSLIAEGLAAPPAVSRGP
ncbi:hypothetical protein J2851_001626 [Azospirillum rugosum]|uniref:Uncharacterized protein n=1 Tax=Azospirillum rugosum TaxID=416170 RepID=A0ABS4SIV7_9PROT|nr:hypothetical protein [Azospirillum rugosum]MDQ0524311.1 hypothetical protein [Azospirillum rugosum]